MRVLFSSLSDEWRTPRSLYDKLNREFDFNFDPCPINHEFNGLAVPWKERNFINPPYSEVADWIRKGYLESIEGKLCVFLVASRTDTRWFHDYVLAHAKEIRFIKGRLRFSGFKNSAPFPSVIIIFDGRQKENDGFDVANTQRNNG